MKSIIASFIVGAIAFVVATGIVRQRNATRFQTTQVQHAQELQSVQAENETLKQRLAVAEKERDRLKADAAEVHKLRGELSTLKKANETLQKTAAAPKANIPETTEANLVAGAAPPSIEKYSEVAKAVADLRGKLRTGQITPTELAYLQQTKVEMEKLEEHPQEFAAFQASMIQSATGINDPQKLEQIQMTIQKVYESANQRGLHLQSRPENDAAWVQQRHQLDRRGTSAVQGLLNETERATFDNNFLGIMGADLGTGVDKTLYPPGFIGERLAAPVGPAQ